ncbi:MAG: polymer-forming cytoskeletal protein [Desulfobacterales bacterium]|nr:polymer-forming cytoskeletal protein [Desulfobacterales bacterium]
MKRRRKPTAQHRPKRGRQRNSTGKERSIHGQRRIIRHDLPREPARWSMEGEISGEENLHVDGRVKGIIRLAGDLFVGAGGVVEAEVDARNVVIQGTVTGKVLARRQLEVQPSRPLQRRVLPPPPTKSAEGCQCSRGCQSHARKQAPG